MCFEVSAHHQDQEIHSPSILTPKLPQRPEPEAYTTHLAHLLLTTTHTFSRSRPQSLTILDLCTGTGCIALLLHSLLVRKIPRLHIRGIDISPCAVQLSRDNMQSNIAAKRLVPPDPSSQSLVFREGDIFSSDDGELWADQQGGLDVLICNPPYISSWGFTHETERSVRKYEPKLAQVPMVTYPGHHKPEDVFYARLLDIGVTTRAQVMLFEVGHLSQALRVVELALGHQGLRSRGEIVVEIWRDWPDAAPQDDEETLSVIAAGEESREVRIKGSGHGRSVFIQCK